MGTPVAGYGGVVKVGSNAVANVRSWELPLTADLQDVSVLGVGWHQYLPTLNGSDVKLDLIFDLTDTTGQVALHTAWLNGTSVSLSLLTSNAQSAVVHTYSGTAYIATIDIKDDVKTEETASVTAKFTGAITYS